MPRHSVASIAVNDVQSRTDGITMSDSNSNGDNDCVAVDQPSAVIDRNCPTAVSTSAPSSLQLEEVMSGNNGDRNTLSNDAATTIGTSSCVAGERLTFYKDGQFVFQLAAHHQEQSCDNQSAITSPCPPAPTVIQQHKNNVKNVEEWPQNKTICSYLVTSSASESKSPQPIQKSQSPEARIGERKQQQYQQRTTPPLLTSIGGAVNVASCTTVVMATITNNIQRRSQRRSTPTIAENTTEFQSQNWQLQSQSGTSSKRSHQAFIMIATKAIKEQRRLLSLPSKQHRRFRKTKTAINRKSLLLEQLPPSDNLECIVRNLWRQKHITDILLRRQLSLNNAVDTHTIVITAIDTAPVSQHIVTTVSSVDSSCPTTGNGKRQSMFYLSSTKTLTIPTTATAIITNSIGMTDSSYANTKYKLGQQQPQVVQKQRPVVMNKNVKETITQSPSLPLVVSNSDHCITAILSGSAARTKHTSGSGVATKVIDTESCISTTSTSAVVLPSKMSHLSSSAPLSLLLTLHKSRSVEIGSSPIVASTNGGFKHPSCDSGKRLAVESTTVFPILPSNIAAVSTTTVNVLRPTVIVPPSSSDTSTVNYASAALTTPRQFPTLHHPSSVAATSQLAAAGYFNMLHHQTAMAYQTRTQLPQQLPKSQPASPMFSHTADDTNNSWKPPISPITEAIEVTMTTTASTIKASYSSLLVVSTVNGSDLLPPSIPSLHQQQQYQPIVPTVQNPPSSYHKHTQKQQNVNRVSLSSPVSLPLLPALHKSRSGEFDSIPIVASTNVGFKHPSCNSRKRSAVESVAVPLTLSSDIAVATTIYNDPTSTEIVSQSSADTCTVNDVISALTTSHQFPTLHHPSSVPATGQSAAASGYFSMLHHQTAMTYQTHTQLPQQLPKLQPVSPMLFSHTGDANNSWKRQVNWHPPIILPITEAVGGSGVPMTTSASIVAPYSSPLVVGSGLLPPATRSLPPKLLHPYPVFNILSPQQYQPVSTVQNPPSSYHQHTQQQNVNRVYLSSSASLSLLPALLKIRSGEFGSSPIITCTNSGFKHPSCDNRKRSAVETTTVPLTLPSNIAVPTTIYNYPSTVNDAIAVLTAPYEYSTLHHPSSVAAIGQFNTADYFIALYRQAMAYQSHAQLPKSQPASPMLFSQFSPTNDISNIRKHQVNRRSPILPITEAVGGSEVYMTTSASTIMAPYSSSLVVAAVNGSGLLPPATASPPPILFHPHPVHHMLSHQHQQYQPVPTVQKPPSSYHQYKRKQGINVEQRTLVTAMGSAQYGYRMDGKYMGAIDVESSSSTDCVTLNLSKDSVAENVSDTSTTST